MTADDRTVYQNPDRTLLIPRPGGRLTDPAPQPAPAQPGKPGSAVTLQRLVAGINPLLGAASQLLALVAQLRATTAHSDYAGLHRQLLKLVGEFEEQARSSGVGKPQVAAARYLLCTFIDEVIASTPWGEDAQGASRGLLQEFHEDESGSEKVFELLDRLSEDPTTNVDLLELFYVCFALGFQGRLASAPNGRVQLDATMERLLELIRPGARSGAARVLSQRWAGDGPHRGPTLTLVPLWMVVVVGAALVVGAVMFMAARLGRQSQPVMQQLHDVRAALRSERAAPPAKPRLAPLLQADVQGRMVEVRDEAQRSVVTLSADRLFVAGTAQVEPGMRDLLGRIAQQLGALPGRVEVIGHTDNQAVESLRFPTSWHLSRDRARAVMETLIQRGLRADRLRAEGRADAEPRAANDSDAGRERNRRIEIQLLLPRPDV